MRNWQLSWVLILAFTKANGQTDQFCGNTPGFKCCDLGPGSIFDYEMRVMPECQGDNDTSELEQLEHFHQAIQVYANQNAKAIRFVNYVIPAIRKDAFRGSRLESLVLSNTKIDLIDEDVGAVGEVKNLKTLLIDGNDYIYGWNWKNLGENLPRLENIVIKNSDLFHADEGLFRLSRRPQYVSLENCNLYWVETIVNSQGLVWLSLSHNHITEIPSEFIKYQAYNLWYMDLSDNNLGSLPDDLTKNTPKLRVLRLSDNVNLKVIGEKVLSPVWNKLEELWISGVNLDISENALKVKNNNCWLLQKLKSHNTGTKPLYWYAAFHKVQNLEHLKNLCTTKMDS